MALCVFRIWTVIVLFAVLSPMSSSLASAAQGDSKADASASSTLRLSLDEALALFLRFPNPVLSVGTLSSFTQGRTIHRSSEISSQVQQLFEMAGKRGYRIESASFGTQSAEANFEDAIRQLSFTVKDSYYRVQLAQRRLALAEENRDRFARILEVNTIR
ncbi:MAG: TolC family protein, partial [Nitrospirae bacterium]